MKAVLVLDKEGNALIAKYYNSPEMTDLNKRAFEARLHKASKSSQTSSYESKLAKFNLWI